MLKVTRRLMLISGLLCVLVSTGWSMKRVVSQQFVLPIDGTVVVDTYRGAINVVPGEGRDVVVSVSMVSGRIDEDEARQALDQLKLSIAQKEGDVIVKATNRHETGVKFIWEDQSKTHVQFTITVPYESNLDLLSRDGAITVGNLRGEMKARTEVGTIFFRSIDGNIDARAESGNVVVSRCTGSVDLRTSIGDVRIGTVGGRARLETISGNVEVQTAQDSVEVMVSEGDIEAGFAEITAASNIRTKLGDIFARINPTESCSISAKARWGKVHNRLSLEDGSGTQRRSRVSGDYNGGGPLIEMRAGGGTVRIDAGEPYLDR